MLTIFKIKDINPLFFLLSFELIRYVVLDRIKGGIWNVKKRAY